MPERVRITYLSRREPDNPADYTCRCMRRKTYHKLAYKILLFLHAIERLLVIHLNQELINKFAHINEIANTGEVRIVRDDYVLRLKLYHLIITLDRLPVYVLIIPNPLNSINRHINLLKLKMCDRHINSIISRSPVLVHVKPVFFTQQPFLYNFHILACTG